MIQINGFVVGGGGAHIWLIGFVGIGILVFQHIPAKWIMA